MLLFVPGGRAFDYCLSGVGHLNLKHQISDVCLTKKGLQRCLSSIEREMLMI